MKELQKLMDDHDAWSDATFGKYEQQRNPVPVILHLSKETGEVVEAINNSMGDERILSEYADCFLLLLDAARLSGYDARDLIAGSRKKMELNKTRDWGKMDANGVIEHLEPGTRTMVCMVCHRKFSGSAEIGICPSCYF